MIPLALGLVLVPLLVAAVALVTNVGTDFYAAGDIAGTELRVRDVGRHAVLTGLYSRDGWDHPGPTIFYLLALPYRLSGSNSIGMYFGALVINGLSIAGMAMMARRRGGTRLLLLTLVGCTLVVHTFGPAFVRDPWNPFITVFPFGLLVFLCWGMACGETWAVPIAAAVATFCVQTHIGYALLVIPLVVWGCTSLVARSLWGRDPAGDRAPPRQLVKVGIVAAGVLAVLWLPPLIDQLVHQPGNLREIAGYFLDDSHQDHHPVVEGIRLMSGQFGWPLPWLTRGRRLAPFAVEPGLVHSSPPPVFLIPFAVAALVAWRRRWLDMRRLFVVVSITLAAGVLWVERTLGPVYYYRHGWTWVVAMIAFVAMGWAAWMFAVSRRPRAEAKWLVPACFLLLGAFAVVNSVSAARAGTAIEPWPTYLADTVPSVVSRLPDRDGDVIVRCDGDEGCVYAVGLLLRLERLGIAARVDEAVGVMGSEAPHRVHRPGPVRAVLHVAINDRLDTLSTRRNRRLIGYTGTLSLRQREARVARVAALDEKHDMGAIDDFAWYDERVTLTRGLGEAVGVFMEPLRASIGRAPR